MQARFIPPQCQDLAAAGLGTPPGNRSSINATMLASKIDVDFDFVKPSCREIFGVSPGFREGFLEALVVSLNIPVVVKYLGENLNIGTETGR